MATNQQAIANKANAAKSTGPKNGGATMALIWRVLPVIAALTFISLARPLIVEAHEDGDEQKGFFKTTFDGKRKGFFIALSGGPSMYQTTIDQPLSNWHSTSRYTLFPFSESGTLFYSGFKIGAGSSEKLIFYLGLEFYERGKYIEDQFENWIKTQEVATFGLGFRYYLKPEAPSAFFCGSFGLASWLGASYNDWGRLSQLEENTANGVLAVGYEFLKNWDVEVGGTVFIREGLTTSIFKLDISHAWY